MGENAGGDMTALADSVTMSERRRADTSTIAAVTTT
jgi:hypothetical protein